MKTQLNHTQIAQLLTKSCEQMDEKTVSALRKARTVALQRQRVHEPVFSLSVAAHRAHLPHTPSQWMATAVLLAAIAVGAYGYWQNSQVPVDLEILTDAMPIDVFVDK